MNYAIFSLVSANIASDETFCILIFGFDGNIFVSMESNLAYYLNGVFLLKLWIFRKPLPVVNTQNCDQLRNTLKAWIWTAKGKF